MWKAAKWGMASLVVALAIVLSGVVGHTIGEDSGPSVVNVRPAENGAQQPHGYAILDEIQGVLEEDFVNPDAVDPEVLREGAIDGLIRSLGDAHTVYITPEEYATGIDLIQGSFEGIGAQVDLDATGRIVIVAPFRDSPAEKAGVRPGDVILKVDGESTGGWSVADAVKRIRGPQGTNVTLTIEHSDGSVEDVNIERATIVIPTVYTRQIQDQNGNAITDLAYIEIQQFTNETVNDLRETLEEIKRGDYKGIILDLRRNPGGGLDATVQVADMFLNGGVVLTEVDRDGKQTVFEAKPGGEGVGIPVAILVGPGSASGSEVLAGALRDHSVAKLVGQTTFGKGSVNHLRELSDGGALYVTIARWLTPNGEQIEGVGLTPDIKVDPDEGELRTGVGPQLYAAIDYLHSSLTQAQR